MELKQLHGKTAIVWINKRRKENYTNQQIYNELTKVYEEKEEIARLIANTPTEAKKDEYRTTNNILFIILILGAVVKVGLGITFAENYLDYIFVMLFPIFFLVMAYIVYTYSIIEYKDAMKFIVLSWLHFFLRKGGDGAIDPSIVFDIIYNLILLFLFFYLYSALTEDSQSEFKKDKNGEFILD